MILLATDREGRRQGKLALKKMILLATDHQGRRQDKLALKKRYFLRRITKAVIKTKRKCLLTLPASCALEKFPLRALALVTFALPVIVFTAGFAFLFQNIAL